MIDKTQPLASVTGQLTPAVEASAALAQSKPTPPLEKEGRAEPKPAEHSAALRNIHLRFRIDPQTHDVTVLMIDAATRRVVRTIPADELRQLAEGELVELLA